MDFIQYISKFFTLQNTSGWDDGGFVCIDISSCYQNLVALMLIFTFLSTLLKYMVVAALWSQYSAMSSIDHPQPAFSTPSALIPYKVIRSHHTAAPTACWVMDFDPQDTWCGVVTTRSCFHCESMAPSILFLSVQCYICAHSIIP